MHRQLLRASLLSFSAPAAAEPASVELSAPPAGTAFIEDGVVGIDDGKIGFVGTWDAFVANGGNPEDCEDLRPGLLVPGFIDNCLLYTSPSPRDRG